MTGEGHQAELERRHRELVERDRWIGLEAEAESARAEAARLRRRLAVAQARLARKSARVEELTARVAALEESAGEPTGLRRILGRRGVD